MIRLTKLALRRPVTIILCLITIAYFGLQSVMGMKLELTPEMEMPMLIIATVYPGASPEDVTDLVTKKEEDAITSLDSVDKVQSISRENVSIVIVQYEYGTNMDTAYINLKKAIDGIQSDLPDDANDPNIMELDINSMATNVVSSNCQISAYFDAASFKYSGEYSVLILNFIPVY